LGPGSQALDLTISNQVLYPSTQMRYEMSIICHIFHLKTFFSILCLDISKIQIKTTTDLFADMGTGGAVRVVIANAYGTVCGTPYYAGPTNFGRGDTFTAGDCNGFIMPKKVRY